MKIAKIDAHHHLWGLGSPHHPMLSAPSVERYFGSTEGLKIEFGVEAFLAVARPQNVVRSIYVETHYAPVLDEVDHIQAIADVHGFPHAIVGRGNLAEPGLGERLDRYMRAANFRGVRETVNWDPDPMMRSAPEGMLHDPVWRAGYAELGDRGLIAEVLVLPNQLADLAALAAETPQTTLVLNHTGVPFTRTPAEAAAWDSGMAALAALPHASVKISGLGMVDHAWTTETIRPFVDRTIALFGADRCMFASNFPVDGLHASYDRIWDAFDEITAHRPTAERQALFHDTAARIYRIA